MSIEESNFYEKMGQNFHIYLYGQGRGPYCQLDRKKTVFSTPLNDYDDIDVDIGVIDVAVDMVIACNAWVRCASANASFRKHNLGIGTVESRLYSSGWESLRTEATLHPSQSIVWPPEDATRVQWKACQEVLS